MATEKDKIPSGDAVLFAVGEAFKEILCYGLAQLPAGAVQELSAGMSEGRGHIRFTVDTDPTRVACEFVANQPDIAPVGLFEIIGGVPSGLPN